MKEINADTELEDDVELVDYPYIGIGKRLPSNKKQQVSCEQIEKIIGG